MSVRRAKTQIRLGIGPVRSALAVHSVGNYWSCFLHADSKDWSGWADSWLISESSHDAQPQCWFYHVTAHSTFVRKVNFPWFCWLTSTKSTEPRKAVGSESDQIQHSEFDPGPVPLFHGDWSWNNFYDHSPLSADSRRVVVSYKGKYVHEVLDNSLVKLAQEKVSLGELISTWPYLLTGM